MASYPPLKQMYLVPVEAHLHLLMDKRLIFMRGWNLIMKVFFFFSLSHNVS